MTLIDSRARVAIATLLYAALGLVSPAARADGPESAKKSSAANPKCVNVHSEARYGAYAYDHLVEIDNSCARAVNCSVKTDVNPEPTQVRVGPNEKTTVITFRGSPAREFKADTRCAEES